MTFAYNGASGLAMDARVHSMATVDVYKKESLPSPRKVANVTASIEGEGTSCQAAGATKVNVKPAVKTAVNVARALGKNGIIVSSVPLSPSHFVFDRLLTLRVLSPFLSGHNHEHS